MRPKGAVEQMGAAELDLRFRDWGVDVAVRCVTQMYSPTTGDVAESVRDVAVTALVSPAKRGARNDAGPQGSAWDREFVIRRCEWPAEASRSTSRIVCEGQVYSLLSWTESAGGELLILSGRAA